MKFELLVDGRSVHAEVTREGKRFRVEFDGKVFTVRLDGGTSPNELLVQLDEEELRVLLEDETEETLKLGIGEDSVVVGRAQARLSSGAEPRIGTLRDVDERDSLVSPLHGRVVSVEVKAGETVEAGQSLLVVEAMKMESVIRAEARRVVREVLVREGEGVAKGQVLMRFSPGEG